MEELNNAMGEIKIAKAAEVNEISPKQLKYIEEEGVDSYTSPESRFAWFPPHIVWNEVVSKGFAMGDLRNDVHVNA
ncbi:hypothetical protein ILUMI_07263 [Ignelater luminosus]|uniref:Uncharacterized protein n=1 Tax=Ignelater luminosus TaxID=2038154 RepID=A0A8K0D3V0_IGNLU|nr:hypothetical protein ILUMI_07263 [Ignelater luminosus]